jgi:hypothetical protein
VVVLEVFTETEGRMIVSGRSPAVPGRVTGPLFPVDDVEEEAPGSKRTAAEQSGSHPPAFPSSHTSSLPSITPFPHPTHLSSCASQTNTPVQAVHNRLPNASFA